MADNLQTRLSNDFYLELNCNEMFPGGLMEDKFTLVQVTTWCPKSDKPFLKPVMNNITDAIGRH